MGGDLSNCVPSEISNLHARSYYDELMQVSKGLSSSIQKQKKFRKMVKIIFESLRKLPSTSPEFSIVITCDGMGPVYLEKIFPTLSVHPALTKVSLRKSGLKSSYCNSIANMILKCPSIKDFDASENELKDKAVIIINAAAGLKNLNSLLLEDCGIGDKSGKALVNLINCSRSLNTVRVAPASFSSETSTALNNALNRNYNIMNASLAHANEKVIHNVTEKNNFIFEIVDSIARSPYQRQFRNKLDAYKSVKGRQMLEGKARQKEGVKGTDLFQKIEEAEERAKNIEAKETVENTESGRFGHAETIGRRPQMEDVSIILPNMPTKGSTLFGLFDGHGGRDAAEYASENLPKLIQEKIQSGSSCEAAYIESFKSIQSEMNTWCVYVGTTAVLASVFNNTLTVANVGDTRCVLCRAGKAVRLTVDHKPSIPEEEQYIQSKGGVVKDGRIGGMLGVSRALGDGFLGECVNPTPYFVQTTLTEEDSFIILACDGVWDVISDQEAVDLIASEIDPLAAARMIRDRAFELESTDNISVIVAFLSSEE